jgi:hypothetical protein
MTILERSLEVKLVFNLNTKFNNIFAASREQAYGYLPNAMRLERPAAVLLFYLTQGLHYVHALAVAPSRRQCNTLCRNMRAARPSESQPTKADMESNLSGNLDNSSQRHLQSTAVRSTVLTAGAFWKFRNTSPS